RAGRLAVLLDRAQARIYGRAHVAVIAPSRAYSARRGFHEEVGRCRHFYRSVLWAVAGFGAPDRRHLRNAVLAIPDCEFRISLCRGGDAADDRRRHIEGHYVVLADAIKPPGVVPAVFLRIASRNAISARRRRPATRCHPVSLCRR